LPGVLYLFSASLLGSVTNYHAGWKGGGGGIRLIAEALMRHILSAACQRNSVPGRIFVEAHTSQQVTESALGISELLLTKMRLVPEEMVTEGLGCGTPRNYADTDVSNSSFVQLLVISASPIRRRRNFTSPQAIPAALQRRRRQAVLGG
jgi:hypothetical protein